MEPTVIRVFRRDAFCETIFAVEFSDGEKRDVLHFDDDYWTPEDEELLGLTMSDIRKKYFLDHQFDPKY